MDKEIENLEGDNNWIVVSKLSANRPNIDLVARSRLLDTLDSALVRSIALIVAPAGFGKSTVLQQWQDQLVQKNIKSAWLNLDTDDGDAHQFLSYLVMAIAHAGIDVAELEVGARNGFSDSPVRSIITSLMRRLQEAAENCVLILDDYHLAETDVLNDILKTLIREAPITFTLVVNSRTMPMLDVPAHVAAGDALEIGPAELRLTKQETLEVLAPEIDEEGATDIYQETEGWPVAVQLARVKKQTGRSQPVQTSASSGLVASYLTDQVLSEIDDDVREFLLSISVLDRFNPELANAVRDQKDSWQFLDKLQPLTALLIPLDSEDNWFRLHHLFAEYLRETLRKTDPDRIVDIYNKASSYYAAKGSIVEAVRYASQAENYDACVDMILETGGWKIILTKGIGYLRNLLRFIPDHVLKQHPRLILARAYLHCKDGEPVQALTLLDSAGLKNRGIDQKDISVDQVVVGSMVNLYTERWDWGGYRIEIDRREPHLETIGYLEAGTLKCEEVVLQFAMGDINEASRLLRQAFTYMRQSGSVLGLNYCYLHAAIAALYEAEFDIAEANIKRALELAESNFGSDSGLKHIAIILDYALKVWRGQAVKEDLEPFSETLSFIEEHDGWTEIYTIGLDAIFHLARQYGENEFANDIADRFLKVAEFRALDRLEHFTQTIKMEAERALGHDQAAMVMRDRLQKWCLEVDPQQDRYIWHMYFLAAVYLYNDGRKLDDAAKTIMAKADQVISRVASPCHIVRFNLAYARLLKRDGQNQLASEKIIAALKMAARQKMAGPFLLDEDIIKSMRDIRQDLRANEDELMTVNFITEILATHQAMRPKASEALLSNREQEILEQVALGKSNKEIARKLELTENTVKFHLKNIFLKLAVNKRTQAIVAAQNLGLLD